MAKVATSESYEPLDLRQRGDVCYALKKYSPRENRHCRRLTPREVKKAVLASPRLQRTVREVSAAGVEGCQMIFCKKKKHERYDSVPATRA